MIKSPALFGRDFFCAGLKAIIDLLFQAMMMYI
jgi:hypothetical protein